MLKTALMLLLLLLLQRRVSYMLCDTQTQVRWRQDESMPSCEGGFNEMIESNRLLSNRPPPYGGMAQIVRDRCDKYDKGHRTAYSYIAGSQSPLPDRNRHCDEAWPTRDLASFLSRNLAASPVRETSGWPCKAS
ncbi:hypothetical protein V8C44DRAFT_331142 [Trichoderma aethiopicum]